MNPFQDPTVIKVNVTLGGSADEIHLSRFATETTDLTGYAVHASGMALHLTRTPVPVIRELARMLACVADEREAAEQAAMKSARAAEVERLRSMRPQPLHRTRFAPRPGEG